MVNNLFVHRYPYVAAEILSSDSQAMVSAFFQTKKKAGAENEEETTQPSDEVITDQEGIRIWDISPNSFNYQFLQKKQASLMTRPLTAFSGT